MEYKGWMEQSTAQQKKNDVFIHYESSKHPIAKKINVKTMGDK